jgi:hypothetical protein
MSIHSSHGGPSILFTINMFVFTNVFADGIGRRVGSILASVHVPNSIIAFAISIVCTQYPDFE